MEDLSSEQMQEILACVFRGEKIEAIKRYRELRDCGLREAKEFVEQLESELREQSPEQFSQSAAGCASMLFLAAFLSIFGTMWATALTWVVR